MTKISFSIYTPKKTQITGFEVRKHCLPNSKHWRTNRKMKNSKNKTTSKRLSAKIEQLWWVKMFFFCFQHYNGGWKKATIFSCAVSHVISINTWASIALFWWYWLERWWVLFIMKRQVKSLHRILYTCAEPNRNSVPAINAYGHKTFFSL